MTGIQNSTATGMQNGVAMGGINSPQGGAMAVGGAANPALPGTDG